MDRYQVIGLFLLLLTAVTAKIQLVGNGYEGVLVSISADVDVNPDLLTTLESMLTNGSLDLFVATRNQMYFREFIFVLPEHWPREDYYEDALDVALEQADIIIDTPNEAVGLNPYVRMYTSCGTGGIFMHLTPTFILDETVRGPYGRSGLVIAHEWGHLRYGVFDEYPYTHEEMFYLHENTWHPTKCSLEVTGWMGNIATLEDCEIDPLTNRPEWQCRYIPDSDSPAVSTIMYYGGLDNMTEFCDDVLTALDQFKHNPLPDNRQNRFCFYQSGWEVMRGHEDFISLSNQTALPDDTDTRPRFRYLQSHARKRVLVLDTSLSMVGDPLEWLRLEASNFILSVVEDGSYLGIIRFAATAYRLTPLVKIDSNNDRYYLVDSLPSSAEGGTSIGSGLLLGLQVLREAGNFSGGSILLVTDGKENTAPFIEDVIPDIVQAGVVVHSLSFGQNADPQLAILSQGTGGQTSFYSGSKNSTGLLDGLISTVTAGNRLVSKKNKTITILTEANIVTPMNPMYGKFYIDSTIGNDTTLIFSFTGFINVDVESPDGPFTAALVEEHSSPESPVRTLRVALGNVWTPGLWSYRVTTTLSRVTVLVNIQSKPRREGQEVIQINSWLSQKEDIKFCKTSTLGVFTEVMRGKTPIVNATVVATVETPSESTFDVVLYDNGLDPDILKADGVYSGKIIAGDFNGNGHYNVKIKVVGNKERTKVFVTDRDSGRKTVKPPLRGFVDLKTKMEPLEDFQRVTTAGEFRLTGYTKLVEDGLPPSRIVDFFAKKYDTYNHTATLQWTAVGDDLDRGRAARYIIHKSLDVNDIIRNSKSASRVPDHHVLLGNLSSPSAAGHREEFIVFLEELHDNDTATVYMSISAVDGAGNEGENSNLVIVAFAKGMAGVKKKSETKSSLIYPAIGAAVIIAIIALAVLVRKCRNSTKEPLVKKMIA